MQEIILIAAMAENRVIGKDNAMPWSIKGNFAHFKEMTMGWPCIMGRKTWESLPKKPLPGRLNIVISKTMTAADSSVPRNELCPQGRALSPRASSVPKGELCPQGRALSPETNSVPENELCPQDLSSVPRDELCPQEQALSPKTSSVPQGELCPQGRALSPRTSSVPDNELCHQESSSVPKDSTQGIKVFPSLSSAIEYCAGYEKIFICGGESIYRQALPLADKIELTLIYGQYEGDTFFPEIDAACWTPSETVNFDKFSIITYTRTDKLSKEQA
jgi:dihydrofolate reductase